MEKAIITIQVLLSAVGAWISARLGILLPVLGFLIVAMVLDYITGMLASKKEAINHPDDPSYGWSSKKGAQGIIKKVGYLCVIAVALMVDYIILNVAGTLGFQAPEQAFFALLVAVWYFLNEVLSIIENVGRMGAPVPEWLSKYIAVLKNKIDSIKLIPKERKRASNRPLCATSHRKEQFMNIINTISDKNVPKWGNTKQYIAVHYLGVVGQNNKVEVGGYGAHYYIYWDGTIYQAAKHDAILWQVGTGGYYTQKHPEARNSNTIGIELCPKCDGNASNPSDPRWYFTTETQEACVQLVKKLMQDLGIPASHVLRHYDIVNKHCPAPYVNNNKYKTSWTWEEFKARLSDGSSGSGGSSAGGTGQMYRIRKSWADAASQIGAYENLDNAKAACKAGYTVYDKDGKAVYSKAETWKATGTATCGGNSVNVRSGAGTSYKSLGQLNKGQRFEVDGKTSGEWVHIKVAGIGIGYMHKDYVVYDNPTSDVGWKAIGTGTCTGSNVNVRSGPGTSYKSLGQLGKENRFEIDGQTNGSWTHIKVHLNGKDQIAWISSHYVKKD